MLAFPTFSAPADCPTCEGWGEIASTRKQGRYDAYRGSYLPTELTISCWACGGVGTKLIRCCRICRLEDQECTCSEDDLESFLSSASFLSVFEAGVAMPIDPYQAERGDQSDLVGVFRWNGERFERTQVNGEWGWRLIDP